LTEVVNSGMKGLSIKIIELYFKLNKLLLLKIIIMTSLRRHVHSAG